MLGRIIDVILPKDLWWVREICPRGGRMRVGIT